MNLQIRTASPPDIPALLDLVHSAYRGDRARSGWTHEADLLDGQRTDAAALTAALNDPKQQIMLALDGTALAGCVQISDQGGGKAYLGLLSIAPERQAQGLGRVLIAAAEEEAKRAFGATVMEMTVIRQREELVAYYERRGYARTGEERPFPLDDPRFGVPKRRDLSFVVLARPL
ncbi:putative acetyltransferase [Sphingomonas changbaiensis NBRC 104936]|uniref:Putative acetyltransferase n=1 Tax=Sphingomonas changbaiensis NBRC 104936 TaxID=1219043 RepID=A0A0E9MML0_9SPHN|nr:GNAT family N-acetyltransferase [Sphingomonas changbaiensis]GAO39007.1 putative acetyltransferase [Sphingomonas changbaiensis NBRC 104936]